MSETSSFAPDWASPPGETVLSLMRQRGLTVMDLANHVGAQPLYMANLLSGALPLLPEIAEALGNLFGASSGFWVRRESQYSSQLEKAVAIAVEEQVSEWMTRLPLNSMAKLGWIDAPEQLRSQKVAACFRFFGVTNLLEWEERNAQVLATVAYKHSESYESRPLGLAAWLRQAEIQADSLTCLPWNKTRFSEVLADIRVLTRQKSPLLFIPKLKQLCAECGVALVVVRTPEGCHATAATRFISENKALIVLSGRYLRDDQFWFSFFHEAGHLILHGQSRLFVEQEDIDQTHLEAEANQFAARFLVPDSYRQRMSTLRTSADNIIRLAREVGVSPGIIVGQLQRSGRLKHSYLNSLKRTYTWESLLANL